MGYNLIYSGYYIRTACVARCVSAREHYVTQLDEPLELAASQQAGGV